ncbi:site-specific recombinase XerD [Arcicella rosea]|uniref:site-specific integrase n=1 Tax=Arcicella rosea TaxID=502909 RepID=UPI00345DD78A
MQEISPIEHNTLANVQTLAEKVDTYGRKGLEGAANTQRAYRADLKHFQNWCEKNNFTMMPVSASTLSGYAAHLADTHKWSSINRRFAAISKLHHLNNLATPTQDRQFKAVMEGIKRIKGIRQKQAPAFNIKEIKNVLRSIETDTNTLLRNKAILLLGFTGAFRRSELVALNLEDLTFSEDGLIVSMGNSKTNQYGDYEEKAIFYSPETVLCPVRTLQTWITTLARGAGPLFVRIRKGDSLTEERLNDKTVNDLVKSYLGEKYSAHSLRASFITIAKLNGADDSEVMRQTKHKTSAMIIRYTRLENIKQHNAAMKLGL